MMFRWVDDINSRSRPYYYLQPITDFHALSQLHEKLMRHSAAANENEVIILPFTCISPSQLIEYSEYSEYRPLTLSPICTQMVDDDSTAGDDDDQSVGEEEDKEEENQGVSCPVCGGRG
jgi:hypothetical protein